MPPWRRCFFRLTASQNGISNNLITKTIRAAMAEEQLFYDYPLPAIRDTFQLCEYNYAIRQIHFPDDMDTLIVARRRLVFEEFFLFILGMQYQKEKRVRDENEFEFQTDSFVDDLEGKLPYELTGAQKRHLGRAERYAGTRL